MLIAGNLCRWMQKRVAFIAIFVVALVLASNYANSQPGSDRDFERQLQTYRRSYSPPQVGKAILVNVPAFELIAFENGEPAFRSRVIVGAPWHPTPFLETMTTKVRFRPTWRPTPSMVASGEYRDRIWPPGERNPLGLAAVHLGPGLLVYLHDTNRRELFEEPYRALSHGCIRVQRWDTLVGWILDIPLAEVHRSANGRDTVDVPAPPIPVSVRYLRRFIDADGRLVRYPDVYHLDAVERSHGPAPEQTNSHC